VTVRTPAGIYIHVPFCIRKCDYCAFYSVTDADSDLAMRYSGALLRELGRLHRDLPVASVYAGGGTPVLLDPGFWAEVLGRLAASTELKEDAELTIEANPGAMTPGDFGALRSAGFNRISIGVQSFDASLLRTLGRIHDPAQAEEAVTAARRAGFDNLSLDLIYGIPGQTPDSWRRDLAIALDLDPRHLSCYELTAEEGTPYWRALDTGLTEPPDEGLADELHMIALERLAETGFEHYEVSSYAQGRLWRSRHNEGYWTGRPYEGFGPSAHSYDGHRRRSWNTSDLALYLERIEAGLQPEGGEELLTDAQLLLERLMLGLRTSEGADLSIPSLHGTIPRRARDLVLSWTSQGLCRMENLKVVPTDRGMLLADGLARDLAAALAAPV
jgi:oxygen-independent coproporphyrinogen-3 oxidase